MKSIGAEPDRTLQCRRYACRYKNELNREIRNRGNGSDGMHGVRTGLALAVRVRGERHGKAANHQEAQNRKSGNREVRDGSRLEIRNAGKQEAGRDGARPSERQFPAFLIQKLVELSPVGDRRYTKRRRDPSNSFLGRWSGNARAGRWLLRRRLRRRRALQRKRCRCKRILQRRVRRRRRHGRFPSIIGQ